MRPLLIVVLQPCIQVRLEFLRRAIDLLAEGHAVELIQHGFVEPFTDPVGLGMPRLGACVIDVLHREIELILMALRCPAIFGSTVGEDPVHRNLVLLEERQDPIIQKLRGRHRGLAVIQLSEAHFAVGVDEGLLVDPAHAFQGPDIEGVLGATVARTFTLEFPMSFFVRGGLLQGDNLGLPSG